MSGKYNWGDIYPELVNKIRWAVCTAFKTPGSNYPFSSGQVIATVYASAIIEIVRAAEEAPGLLGSTSLLRGFLTQERIRSELDKLS